MSGTSSRYSGREELLNALSHWLGVAAIIAAGVFMLPRAAGITGIAWGFYFFSLIFMFGASALYHSVRDEKLKFIFRKFDHCAIYLLISGTYAPLMAELFPDRRGAVVMGILGILTFTGIIIKFCADSKLFHRIEVGIYLFMGWLCVFLAKPLITAMPRQGLLLLLYGGIAYTGGVIFYAIKKEFFHAVWHLFVLAGAILQFFAVLTLQ